MSEQDKKRFFDKVNKTDTCWLWTGCKHPFGYGEFRYENKRQRAHRVSWILAGNTISEGLVIRHKCLSKNCVNPEHLETGTMKQNGEDMIRDGTNTAGEKHPFLKLTDQQVLEIR